MVLIVMSFVERRGLVRVIMFESDVGVLHLFRDSRFFGTSTGRSDTVVESGTCRLLGPDLGMFRPENAGCFFGNSVLIPCAAQ